MDGHNDDAISKLGPRIACDDMEAAISRLRDLLDAAESYMEQAASCSTAGLR